MELLVVVAIGSLLMAMTPLAYQRINASAEYRSTVRTMRTEMRAAREAALQTHVPQRFQVDVPGRRFGAQNWHPLPDSVQVHTTVADVEMRDGVASILFLPQGGATGGSVEIVRAAGASRGMGTRLRVDWLTGQITQESLLP